MLKRFKVIDKQTNKDVTHDHIWYIEMNGILYVETGDVDTPCQEVDRDRYAVECCIKHSDVLHVYRDNFDALLDRDEEKKLAEEFGVRQVIVYHSASGFQYKQVFSFTSQGE